MGSHPADPAAAALADALRTLLPHGVAFGVWGVHTTAENLLGDEADAVRRAVDSRRVEFARGRACARHALRSLGVAPGPIPAGSDRAPIWPEGVVGSISHAGALVCAAAARADAVAALGIDIEDSGALDRGVRGLVVLPEDEGGPGPNWEKVVFSAKESVFKAIYPGVRQWVGFEDVVIAPGVAPDTLAAASTGRNPAASRVDLLQGACAQREGFVLTVFWQPGQGVP